MNLITSVSVRSCLRGLCRSAVLAAVLLSNATAFGQTTSLPGGRKQAATPQAPRAVAYSGNLRWGTNEREIITNVVIQASTTARESFTIQKGFDTAWGVADFVNPTPSTRASTYQGYVAHPRLSRFQIHVTYKRYVRVKNDWYYRGESTASSPVQTW